MIESGRTRLGDFGNGERRLPQGILTCGICANQR
jgi:hypothetical protein